METHKKKIIILFIIGIVLLLILLLSQSTKEQKNHQTQKDKEITPRIVVKNFYDWYKSKKETIIDNTETIVEGKEIKEFLTEGALISAKQNPLTTSKKADVFICTSKKSEMGFPTTFSELPIGTSTEKIKIEAKSEMPHTIVILFDITKNKIESISCPVIPNL